LLNESKKSVGQALDGTLTVQVRGPAWYHRRRSAVTSRYTKGAGMNEARRKEIQRALMLIEQAKGIFELPLAQEQEDFDNMPEDLQDDETGQRAEGRD
jgi:hypothetical protein